jgi:anti-sigma B factor antagonist
MKQSTEHLAGCTFRLKSSPRPRPRAYLVGATPVSGRPLWAHRPSWASASSVSEQKGRYVDDYTLPLSGEVDLAAARGLMRDLQRAIECNVANVVVDCADVTFIDSTGMYVLLQARRALEREGRRMHIVNVRDKQRRAFEVIGQTDVLGSGCEADARLSHRARDLA